MRSSIIRSSTLPVRPTNPNIEPTLIEKQLVFTQEFKSRQTNAIGETLTLGSLYVPATAYTRPVQILNGVQDYFYCQGNCLAEGTDYTLATLDAFFPNRDQTKSEAVNIGDVGHNINLHFKRTEAFARTLDFIANAGIAP